MKPTLVASLSLGALVAFSLPALAWDEDTCAAFDPATVYDAGVVTATDGGVTTVRDPYCANPQPLLGSNASIAWDHATAHWELTYAMARCVGIADAEARRIAAADEATDMSSPACGSKAANANGDQYYREGYACGYEIGARGDADASALPPYTGTLRWSQTDRCRRTTASNPSLRGHSEFFHYPYWTDTTDAGVTSTVLERLSGWAAGSRADLFDPVAAGSNPPCDMANPTPSGATACPTPTVSGYTEFDAGVSVCRSTTGTPTPDEGWRMPQSTVTGDERAFRMGIYLHSLGDSYSHFTCQWFSGQTVDTATWRVTVPVTNGSSTGATDHTSYKSGTFAYRCSRPSLPTITLPDGTTHQVTTEECNAACDLGQHDREFGSYDTAGLSTAVSVSSLRNASIHGMDAVWLALATYAGRTARDDSPRAQASVMRYTVPNGFNAYYDGASRQAYVRDLFSQGREQPCACPNGAYDWVPGTVDRNGTRTPGYCETLTALAFSASSTGAPAVTAATLTTAQAARYYAVGTFRRGDGSTSTRVINNLVDWSATGAATVNNTVGNLSGTITAGASAGAARVAITRLGVTASLNVTVN
ncbi:MAG: hypothetical protein U0326_18420 [Polyangiales bacterium]